MWRRKINGIFQNKFVSNFSYLTLLQVVSVAIPLVIYPILILRLGSEVYGKIIYATTLNAYLLVLVNYGFDISTITRIAENKKDKVALSFIFKNTIYAKGFLLILSYVFLGIAFFTIPFVRENAILCLLSTIVTLGELLFPKWFFLGIEELKYSSITVVISKLLSLILIYFLVERPGDYLLVPLILGIGSIVGGIYALVEASRLVDFFGTGCATSRMLKPNYSEIKKLLKEGFSFFVSRGFVVVREKTGLVIVGQLFGFQEVSVLDLVLKIIRVLSIPIDMINTVIFPRVANTKEFKLVKKGAIVALAIAGFFYATILFFPYDAVSYFDNDFFNLTRDLLFIFGFGLLLQVFVFFTGNTALVVFGYDKEFNFTVVFGGIIYLFFLSYGYIAEISLNWIGYCTLISYSVIIISRLYYINKYKIWK